MDVSCEYPESCRRTHVACSNTDFRSLTVCRERPRAVGLVSQTVPSQAPHLSRFQLPDTSGPKRFRKQWNGFVGSHLRDTHQKAIAMSNSSWAVRLSPTALAPLS